MVSSLWGTVARGRVPGDLQLNARHARPLSSRRGIRKFSESVQYPGGRDRIALGAGEGRRTLVRSLGGCLARPLPGPGSPQRSRLASPPFGLRSLRFLAELFIPGTVMGIL